MIRWKKTMIVVCLTLFVIGAVCILIMHQLKERKLAGEELYSRMQAALTDYPRLPEPYCFTVCYFCDGTTEYMLLKNGDKQITGQRNIGEDAVYYTDGRSWRVDQEGELAVICNTKDPVEEKVADIVEILLADQDMTYTYHRAIEPALPLWVYPDERYIQCHRPEYFDCTEVMVYNQDNKDYIRWDIVKSADNVTLYLYACGYDENRQPGNSILIRGWGTLAAGVANAVTQQKTGDGTLS